MKAPTSTKHSTPESNRCTIENALVDPNQPTKTGANNLAQRPTYPNSISTSTTTDLELVLIRLNSGRLSNHETADYSRDLDEKIIAGQISKSSLKKYLNPAYTSRAYGRFLKRVYTEFGIAEGVGTVTALGAAYATHRYGGDAGGVWVSAAGSGGESIGFYGTSYVQRLVQLLRDKENPTSGWEATKEASRYIVGTFSVAEIIDTPFRTVTMNLATKAFEATGLFSPTTSLIAGVTIGKLISDQEYLAIAKPFSDAYYRDLEKRRAGNQDASKLSNALSLIGLGSMGEMSKTLRKKVGTKSIK